jgi:hypothetical protein
MLTCFAYVLHPQLLSQSSADVPALQAEVTWAREVVPDMLAAHTTAMLAAAVQDNATLHVKDAEDQATIAQREVLEWVSRAEAENATALASAHEDSEVLAVKVTLLKDELAVEYRAQEMSEREHRAHFEELNLLQTWGSEMCHAIIGPARAKHLFEGMWLSALCHTEMVGKLITFWAAVSSVAELVVERSPGNTAHVVVVGELLTKFQKVEDRRSRLERPTRRKCDLLLGPLPSQVWLADV